MMGKEKSVDVTDETFENLFITARTSQKTSSRGRKNRSVARANVYDGPKLSLEDLKNNYKKNTNSKTSPVVKTNLLQPEKFKPLTEKTSKYPLTSESYKKIAEKLDHPIIAVVDNKNHYYSLDTQFVGPVIMNRSTRKNKRKRADGSIRYEIESPNLKPTTVGKINLGNIIGEILTPVKGGSKKHPLYDYIEVDAMASAPEGMGNIKKFKEGGAVMEDTSNDMDAMLLEEQVDPVSGNTAPLGALPAEVRDDIEVNVSPNEFVVNAATVRYFGQEFFDNLQDTAEDGWERIAANDDLPFRDDELEFEETEDALEDENLPKRSFAEGDIVEATGEQAEGYENVPDAVGGGYGGYGGSGQSYMGYDRKPYTNEDGKEIVVYFYNGRPLSKIPEGYTEVGVTEGGGGAVGTAVTEAITEVEQKKDRDGSTQWARDIGVMEGASNEEVFRAMDMLPDGTKLNDGYWDRDPEGWNSSDWSNYNESLNSGFKIPGTDIKINAAEAVFDSISVLAGVPGYIFGASMKLGKQNLAKKANEWAKNALKNNFKSTTVDQRTILDTAYSTGVMLGEIAESVSQLEWAKKTYNIVKLPEVDQAKVDARRGPDPNLGYGWTEGLNGRELASAIDLHNNYKQTHQKARGMASIDKNGKIIGSKAGIKTDGGFQQGLFEGSNKIVMRYKPTAAISSNYATNVFQDIGYEVRMDAQGNAYYMAGTSPFNQQRIMVPQGSVSTNGDAIKLQAAKDAEAEAIANQAAKDAEAEAIANQATKDAEAAAIASQAVSVAPVVASTPRVYAGDVSSPVTSITSQRKTATDKANERAQQSNAERKAAASKSYNTRKAAEKKNESAAKDAGLTRGIGGQYGRAEGGLVQKPKKK